MILFIPIILVSTFTIIQRQSFYSFFIPLIGTLLVGINEELVYRGIVFTNAVEEKGLIKGIFISAIAFSLLHAVNIFCRVNSLDVILQLATTLLQDYFLLPVIDILKIYGF